MGSATGVDRNRQPVLSPRTPPGLGSTAEAGDTFGSALGVGDFNNDGFD